MLHVTNSCGIKRRRQAVGWVHKMDERTPLRGNEIKIDYNKISRLQEICQRLRRRDTVTCGSKEHQKRLLSYNQWKQ